MAWVASGVQTSPSTALAAAITNGLPLYVPRCSTLPDVIALNEELLAAVGSVIEDAGLPAHTVQFGAKGCVTWAPEPIRNYRDYKATDFDIAFAQWIHGINRGVLLPPGLDEQWLISVMHSEADAMHYADVFDEFVAELTG